MKGLAQMMFARQSRVAWGWMSEVPRTQAETSKAWGQQAYVLRSASLELNHMVKSADEGLGVIKQTLAAR